MLIRFPVTCSFSGPGVERPSESCSTMAKGSGWRRSDCQKDVSSGGRQAPSQRGSCRHIRRSCCWRQVIQTRKPRPCGEKSVEIISQQKACVLLSSLAFCGYGGSGKQGAIAGKRSTVDRLP